MNDAIPMTVANDDDLVVFLLGMRINRLHRIDLWLPVALAMTRMMKELRSSPDSGFLGCQPGGLRNPTLMVQYWRSTDDLLRYARDRDGEHFPAWADFNKRLRASGAVGVWHETYSVPRHAYECVYQNMPAFGLGEIRPRIPARGERGTAAKRLRLPAATDRAA